MNIITNDTIWISSKDAGNINENNNQTDRRDSPRNWEESTQPSGQQSQHLLDGLLILQRYALMRRRLLYLSIENASRQFSPGTASSRGRNASSSYDIYPSTTNRLRFNSRTEGIGPSSSTTGPSSSSTIRQDFNVPTIRVNNVPVSDFGSQLGRRRRPRSRGLHRQDYATWSVPHGEWLLAARNNVSNLRQIPNLFSRIRSQV